ncbi:MAG: hypothetical protein WCF67_07425, partial [Chitinophagaceae bacterium]
ILKDAEQFAKRLLPHSSHTITAQKELDGKLSLYRTDKNKYYFLKELRKLIHKDEVTHNCGRQNCGHERLTANAKFIIDQELESLETYFSPDFIQKEEFAGHEKVDMNAKIDEVLESLQNLGLGQQIIFEEIEELKQHLNLNKKTWTQLLKGKLIDLAVASIISKETASRIFDTITESIIADRFVLPQ